MKIINVDSVSGDAPFKPRAQSSTAIRNGTVICTGGSTSVCRVGAHAKLSVDSETPTAARTAKTSTSQRRRVIPRGILPRSRGVEWVVACHVNAEVEARCGGPKGRDLLPGTW